MMKTAQIRINKTCKRHNNSSILTVLHSFCNGLGLTIVVKEHKFLTHIRDFTGRDHKLLIHLRDFVSRGHKLLTHINDSDSTCTAVQCFVK